MRKNRLRSNRRDRHSIHGGGKRREQLTTQD